jgi:hypothetical protein
MSRRNVRYSADAGVIAANQSRHRSQIIQFGVASGGHLGN